MSASFLREIIRQYVVTLLALIAASPWGIFYGWLVDQGKSDPPVILGLLCGAVATAFFTRKALVAWLNAKYLKEDMLEGSPVTASWTVTYENNTASRVIVLTTTDDYDLDIATSANVVGTCTVFEVKRRVGEMLSAEQVSMPPWNSDQFVPRSANGDKATLVETCLIEA